MMHLRQYIVFAGTISANGTPSMSGLFWFYVDEVESYKVIKVRDYSKQSREWAKKIMITMMGLVPPPDPAIPRDSLVYVYITWKPGFEYPQDVIMRGEDFIDFEKAFKGID